MSTLLNVLPMFLLIFCRITAFFVVSPIFSAKNIPMQAKIGLSVFLSLIIISVSFTSMPVVNMDNLFILEILKEILVGITLGFVAYMIFGVIQLAGAFIDMQMGLSFATVLDPVTGGHTQLTGQFHTLIATLLFLLFNGHHFLIQALIQSYELIPVKSNVFAQFASGDVTTFLITILGTVFVLALQMAAPIVVALFLTDLGLGILSKVAPQFNIFVVGMPIKILIGFLMLAALVPGLGFLFEELFKNLFASLNKMLEILAKK